MSYGTIREPTTAPQRGGAAERRTGGVETPGQLRTLPSLPPGDADRAVTGGFILELPRPPSVNKTRKVDWWGTQKVKTWQQTADAMLLAAKYRPLYFERFELRITLSETHTKMDLDNGLKALIDYLRRISAIADDSPKHMRKLTVEYGHAPTGCRVEIRPWGAA